MERYLEEYPARKSQAQLLVCDEGMIRLEYAMCLRRKPSDVVDEFVVSFSSPS